jgi:hypothetical protein
MLGHGPPPAAGLGAPAFQQLLDAVRGQLDGTACVRQLLIVSG